MEKKKYYYLYQITNLINGKIYVGVHQTNNLNDDYMGSGLYLRRSYKEHGKENFKKDILKFFNSQEDMFKEEVKTVDTLFVKREDTYNLREGGKGGSLKGNKNSRKGGENAVLNKSGVHTPEERAKQKIRSNSKEHKERSIAQLNKSRELAQTPKARKKRNETLKRINHAQGEKNSQYGMMWITDLNRIKDKRIKKDLPIPEGWKKGRKKNCNK